MKLCRYCRYPYLLADNTVQLKPVVYKYMGHVIKHIDVLVYEYRQMFEYMLINLGKEADNFILYSRKVAEIKNSAHHQFSINLLFP